MAEQQKPQRDFFDEFMFGRPISAPQTDTQEAEPQPEKEEPTAPATPPSQLEQMLMLVQTLGPAIDKLAPLIGAAHTFFTKQKKEEPSSKKPAEKQTKKQG
ncbi:hypothetical protein M3212_20615 [Alkalihalobacillus oceani]|uniref:hypothetical protein n=1 Tax=Halalkalibacter oceani TaxID=1653776 RepID=UPI00203B25B8|nr:hypothetical protein [Halalkalibacter oceani]MCM3763124.1 hypothetical protein [Halalkalibacter oceani]